MEVLKITYKDRTIYGELYTPEGEGSFPVIILSHGYNGSANDWRMECEYYVEHGYIAYAYDFTGGSVESRSIGLATTEMTVFTEKEDLLAVLDYIRGMGQVDKDRIFLFGGSMGGFVTALVAEERKDIVHAVALYFPAFCIPDNWRDNYQSLEDVPESFDFWGMMLGKGFVKAIRDFETFDNIGAYGGNVYIIHGDKDIVVPLAYSKKALGVYSNARLKVLYGEEHGFSPEGSVTAMKEVLSFMDEMR